MEIVIILILLVVGFTFGKLAEHKHMKSLGMREVDNGSFLVSQIKTYPQHAAGSGAPQIVVAETVVATDYFKSFLANLRRLFGGEVRSFHSLLVRARRETTQRLVERAREQGYNAICNVRLETADVGGSTASRKGAAMVAILGSATAYHSEVRQA